MIGNPVASAKRRHESEDGHALRDEIALSIRPPVFSSVDLPKINESRERFLKYGLRLYQAALEGDWDTAEGIFKDDPHWITAPITKRNDTALHIAAAAKQTDFVKRLVDLMIRANNHLDSQNIFDNTAFCYAASSGIVEIAEVMVERNRNLPNIKGSKGMKPLLMAILLGHKKMVSYILMVTDNNQLTDVDRIEMLISAVEADLFDVALHFLNNYPHLALLRNSKNETVLHALSLKQLKSCRTKQSKWKSILNLCSNIDQDVEEKKLANALQVVKRAWSEVIKQDEEMISELIGQPWRLLFVAAETGNVEFLTTLILLYPDVIWKVDEENQTIFHVAIENRHVEIFNLIHEIGAIKDLIATYMDHGGNNMLHLAAQIAPSHRLNSVSGAALQMQHELLWFEVVKDVVQPQYVVAQNAAEQTPQELFTEAHEELRTEGEEWMKKTAESCTLVATLITTVVFTAAFTLPGGNNSDNGSPILLRRPSFMVFSISNAISLFASSTSILMFLSILTSRYAEYDFLTSLPFKLMVGLTSLFVSIATMMVAFTATFFVTFQDGVRWIPIPIALLASIPVVLFAFQQYPLLYDIYCSTYRSWTLFKCGHTRKLSWKKKKDYVDWKSEM